MNNRNLLEIESIAILLKSKKWIHSKQESVYYPKCLKQKSLKISIILKILTIDNLYNFKIFTYQFPSFENSKEKILQKFKEFINRQPV